MSARGGGRRRRGARGAVVDPEGGALRRGTTNGRLLGAGYRAAAALRCPSDGRASQTTSRSSHSLEPVRRRRGIWMPWGKGARTIRGEGASEGKNGQAEMARTFWSLRAPRPRAAAASSAAGRQWTRTPLLHATLLRAVDCMPPPPRSHHVRFELPAVACLPFVCASESSSFRHPRRESEAVHIMNIVQHCQNSTKPPRTPAPAVSRMGTLLHSHWSRCFKILVKTLSSNHEAKLRFEPL